MFGKGNDPENNKKPHFPVTGGSVLDGGGNMNNARQSIHGSPNKISRVEDRRTALGNQFAGLQTRCWRTHEPR